MSKVRVYEVAKQLNMDQKSLVALFQSIGVGDVRNHMSAVESDQVERLKRHLERQKTPEVVEERIRPTVVKRKARANEPEVPVSAPSQSGAAGPAPASHSGVAPHAPASSAGTVVRRSPEGSSRGVSIQAKPESKPFIEPPPAPESAPAYREPEIPISALPAAPPSEQRAATLRSDLPVEPPAPPVEVVKPLEVAPRSSAKRSQKGSRAGADAPPSTSVGNLDFDGDDREAPVVEAAPVVVAAEVAAPVVREPTPPPPPAVVEAVKPEPVVVEEAPQTQVSPAREPEPRRPAPAVVPPPPVVEPGPPPSSPPPRVVDAPKRPSTPPRTGIEVWGGRPGVPMPAARTTAPPQRRTTYDPRASAAPARPAGPMSNNFPNRGGSGRPGQRPGGFGQMQGRNRFGSQSSSQSKRPPTMMEMAAHKKVIKIEESVSLQKLAGMMSLKVVDVLMKLLGMGMTGVNINSSIDADTAKILASEFGWTVEDVALSEEQTLVAAMGLDDTSDYALEPRPPIVTVMGHVDHGKTSLLDRIRKASVAAGEAGGITQHIGAYRVETSKGTIAFLDTPGHEAFTAMRARGAQVTDVVILVVAADDGVMPQTKEAISHAQAAKVPIIVAVNKIDKPSADVERIKRDLSALGLTSEEWGGETLFCLVSALTGQGVEQLLEAVALQSEVLELSAAPKRRAHGVVIEALLDRGRGPVARVMIQDGTLRPGDVVVAGAAWGKVRALTDEHGRNVAAAGPATPVEVLGLNEVPSAGDPVHAVKDAKTAEEIAEQRRKKASSTTSRQDVRISLDSLNERLKEGEQLDLKLIIKGDVQGSVEAVAAALQKLSTPKVKVTIVHSAVGAITEGDVNLAVASRALIVGFNVRPAGKASSLAESGAVEIRLYTIIYNAVDDIKAAMEGLLPTTKLEKNLGTAEIRKVFKITKVGIIAGCMVTSGVVKRGAEARLVRDGAVVWTGKLSSLRRIKDDAKEVPEGMECGISLENYTDMKEGDKIEAFEIEEQKQKL
jgi:translation initiation factor IF-2